jgi:hypothetical protein
MDTEEAREERGRERRRRCIASVEKKKGAGWQRRRGGAVGAVGSRRQVRRGRGVKGREGAVVREEAEKERLAERRQKIRRRGGVSVEWAGGDGRFGVSWPVGRAPAGYGSDARVFEAQGGACGAR